MFYEVLTSMEKLECREKVHINKLTTACNPQANGSSELPNQNASFAKAML